MKSLFALASALLLAFSLCETSAAESKFKDLSSEDFLKVVRNPPGRESWAKMDGLLTHRRRGAEDVEAKMHLGLLFTPARTVAQMNVDGGETYNVGQAYEASPDSTVVAMTSPPKSGKPLRAQIGVRPQDITMTFLFWKALPELPRDSVKGQDCRVFDFESPDKSEIARAYISAEYCFPLKTEWFKAGEKKPYRTLEVDSFKKENDFWLVGSLLLYGPGWKTKIEFENTSAGFSKDGVPKDLFFESK
jgi:hypothetical protein